MIVQKLYYERYQIDELKGYIIPAFKKTPGIKAFINIVAKESDLFAKTLI
jgi:hypothetical protein